MKQLHVLKSIAGSTATRLLLALAVVGPSAPASALQAPDAARPAIAHYNLKAGLALKGYDPTAYFPEGGGKPVEGRADLQSTYRGVTYRFASEANLARFLKAPGSFEPAYGGWCAYAMSGGDKVEVDPKSFLIEDDRLLVFYKGFLNDTRKKWQKEGSAELAPKAGSNWQQISAEVAGRDVSQFNLASGLALQGYDPIAYESGGAQRGQDKLVSTFDGVEYRFTTEASRRTFLADPASHEPRYGGWCAWAMSQGKKVAVDPEAFVRDDEGLFLFYNADKRDEWIAARAQMKPDGDRHWASFNAGS